MRVDNTVSDLMSILQKKRTGGDDAASTASSFASVLKNIMANSASAQAAAPVATAPASTAPASTATATPSATPAGAGAAASSGVAQPAETAKSKSWEEDLAEKMTDPNYLPRTVKEANERMQAVEGKLKELLTEAMKENDLENAIGFAGDFVDGEYRITPYIRLETKPHKIDLELLKLKYPWERQGDPSFVPEVPQKELTAEERKAKADFYKNLGNTPEINALAEEYAINSAICRSAFMSGDFHRQYERDPEGTMADIRSQKWGEMKTSIWGNMRTNTIVCNTFQYD